MAAEGVASPPSPFAKSVLPSQFNDQPSTLVHQESLAPASGRPLVSCHLSLPALPTTQDFPSPASILLKKGPA